MQRRMDFSLNASEDLVVRGIGIKDLTRRTRLGRGISNAQSINLVKSNEFDLINSIDYIDFI